MLDRPVIMVTGASSGIGRDLAEHYARAKYQVVGCSRRAVTDVAGEYRHFQLDVTDEGAVKAMFSAVRKDYGRLDALLNNAGIASMNHVLTTPLSTVLDVLRTNVLGTFLFCREAAKLMRTRKHGRIVNFASVAVPLKLEGEAIYAASKAAVISLTEVLSRELADFGVTVNAIGPTPIRTALIAGVAEEKLNNLVARQAIRRFGEYRDVTNVTDFFLRPESDFVTGQILYLGGV
ncbi:MAG TPA: SDR family oxidoreductase [Pirellulales bacterium]